MGSLVSKQNQNQPQTTMSTPPTDQLPPTEPPPVQLTPPEPAAQSTSSNPPQHAQDDDPFSQDDDFFSTLQITQYDNTDQDEPPPKRMRVSSEVVVEDVVDSTNQFGDSEDDDLALCEIADALEDSMEVFGDELFAVNAAEEDEEDKSVPIENRFKTSLGHPHPLLIPHIYEKVLSYVKTPSEIKTARRICTSWRDQLHTQASETLTLRNVSHATQKYPYGLGFTESQETFTTPFQPLNVTRILVADPCIVFNKPEVTSFFRGVGSNIKYLGFDANLWCKEHWGFIRNVLINWCVNLEELELIGVTCFDTLAVHSELNSQKVLKLRKLKVSWGANLERDHYHYSTVTKYAFNHRGFLVQRFGSRRDGGLIGKILRSSPQFNELVINFDFQLVSTYLMHVRVMDDNVRNIKRLELVGIGSLGVDSMTFRLLVVCQVRLATFVAGPVEPNVEGRVIQNFLASQAGSLEHFELRGVKIDRNDGNRLGMIRVNVPEMPFLRVFRITDVCRIRVGNLSFAYRCPGLEVIEFGTEEVNQRYKTGVFRYINRLFTTGVYDAQHLRLKEFVLRGCYANIIDHGGVVRLFGRAFSNVEKVGVGVGSSSRMVGRCLDEWRGYHGLVGLELSVVGDNEVVDFGVVGGGLMGFRGLRNLGFCVKSVPLRLGVVEEWGVGVYEMVFDGVILHDEEASSIATLLAQKNNYTVFKNLRIYKAGFARNYNYAGRRHVDIKEVTLTLVNLPVLVQQTFKTI